MRQQVAQRHILGPVHHARLLRVLVATARAIALHEQNLIHPPRLGARLHQIAGTEGLVQIEALGERDHCNTSWARLISSPKMVKCSSTSQGSWRRLASSMSISSCSWLPKCPSSPAFNGSSKSRASASVRVRANSLSGAPWLITKVCRLRAFSTAALMLISRAGFYRSPAAGRSPRRRCWRETRAVRAAHRTAAGRRSPHRSRWARQGAAVDRGGRRSSPSGPRSRQDRGGASSVADQESSSLAHLGGGGR